jgi:hypothetical protein
LPELELCGAVFVFGKNEGSACLLFGDPACWVLHLLDLRCTCFFTG